MFSIPKLKNDQVEEPDLAEPRNGVVFSHSSELWTSKLSAKTFTKITETLDLSNLEPKRNLKSKGYKEKVCLNHSNGGPNIQDAELVFINVSNCRTRILDILKTCWDFKVNKYTNIFPAIADINSLLYSYYKSSKTMDSTLSVGDPCITKSTHWDSLKRLQRKLIRESWRPGTGRIVLVKRSKAIDKRTVTI